MKNIKIIYFSLHQINFLPHVHAILDAVGMFDHEAGILITDKVKVNKKDIANNLQQLCVMHDIDCSSSPLECSHLLQLLMHENSMKDFFAPNSMLFLHEVLDGNAESALVEEILILALFMSGGGIREMRIVNHSVSNHSETVVSYSDMISNRNNASIVHFPVSSHSKLAKELSRMDAVGG